MSAPATAASSSDDAAVSRLVEHLFRREAGRLVAALARRLGRDGLELAQDVVQDALVQALRTWPFRGVPDDPAGWLFRVASNRALDVARRDVALRRREPLLREWIATRPAASLDAPLPDDELALVFACCHPAVPPAAGIALALRTIGGLSIAEIARAFVADDAAVAQRIVRARRRLREADVVLEIPASDGELTARLPAVLEAVYLLFNEGYSASEGDTLVRRELCGEALRLVSLLAGHPATARPETHALAALLHLQAARLSARVDAEGAPVLLAGQDRARWDGRLVATGFRHLACAAHGEHLTRWHLEAEIASRHALAPSVAATDWRAVLAAYDALAVITPTIAVRVHRAVAVGMVRGARDAVDALDAAERDAPDERYLWLHATRAHWHAVLGDRAAAAADYRRALALAMTVPQRRLLESRLDAV